MMNDKYVINRELLDQFIDKIEALKQECNENDYVQDGCEKCSKKAYLENVVSEAKELVKYGECKIALENMLENLNEASILLDEDVINLARQAFNTQLTASTDNLLTTLTKR